MKTYCKSPIGVIRIESSEKGISGLVFMDNIEDEEDRKGEMTSQFLSDIDLSKKYADNELIREDKITSKMMEVNEMSSHYIIQLDEYFNNKREAFDLKLDLKGTDFQKKVWEELLKIPFGKTISYKDLSLKLGNVKAIRAVAAANGANPVSIIVPCHRVIGSDGSLTGYAGGLWRKRWLLDLEFIISLSVSPQ
jgi:methylated-DNA-[protein]-cysteine S-methyltransferase